MFFSFCIVFVFLILFTVILVFGFILNSLNRVIIIHDYHSTLEFQLYDFVKSGHFLNALNYCLRNWNLNNFLSCNTYVTVHIKCIFYNFYFIQLL